MNEFEDEFTPEMNIPGMAPPIDGEQTMFILNQLNKCCCKISGGKGSGFLCKIIFSNSTNLFPALITNNHVLGEDDISKGKQINFSLENDKFLFSIIIDDSRIAYTNIKFDCTIIEIRENDNLDIKSFLEIDESIYDNALENYKSKSIYLLQYPKGEKAKYAPGTIGNINIDNYIITHKCSSEAGSSGGPLIDLLTKKVIGIHNGCVEKKKVNTGVFFKPIIEDFYNLKFKNVEKMFNNINKIKYANIYNYNQNNKLLDKNLDLSSNPNPTSLYYLILFLSICHNCNMYKDLAYIIFLINHKGNEFELRLYYYFLIICGDIILGILLFISEKFLDHITIIFLSLFLFFFNFPLSSIIHFIGLKSIKSSIFYIIPNWNNQIINAINRGEIIANIILIFIYSKIEVKDRDPAYKEEDKYIYYGYNILNSLTIIYTLTIFIYNYSLFNKISEKEKKKMKLNSYNINYIKKKSIFNILIILNYSFSFSFYPLIDFLNNYRFTKNAYILFIIFDIVGRSLAILINKFISKGIFKATVFFRFILFFILSKFLDEEADIIYEYLYIVVMGILSGICSSFAYYYPLNIKKEAKRDNFIYFLKSGKYYLFSKLLDEPKLQSNEKKFH